MHKNVKNVGKKINLLFQTSILLYKNSYKHYLLFK